MVVLALVAAGCTAHGAATGVEKPGPEKTTIHLAHAVTVTMPAAFNYNARLEDGTVATKKPEPAKVDPLFPKLTELQYLYRSAPELGEADSDKDVILSTQYEDGEYHTDIQVNVVWLSGMSDVRRAVARVSDHDQLDAFAAQQDEERRKERSTIAFMDRIAIRGWLTKGGYP